MNAEDKAPRRHPSEATLLAHASGSLGTAHRLVVATHAAQCMDCHNTIIAAERVGGVLLDSLVPAALQPAALQLCLAQLDAFMAVPRSRLPADSPLQSDNLMLPLVLQSLRPGRLRWLAPGIRYAPLFRDERGALHLLRVHPNIALPPHTHRGLELTCVLQGAFHDGSGRYLAGDVAEVGDENDTNHDHRVVANAPEDCTCIMAVTGRLRFRSLLARLLQPIMPF